MTTQEKIVEAKKLLEQYAPKGEFLAYINRDEAKTLKELGGSGIIIKETGIPSFVPWMPIMMAVSTGISIMGNRQNIKNIQANLAWKQYQTKMEALYEKQKLAKNAAKVLSEQRARVGGSGIQFTGSPLINADADYKKYQDDLMWAEQGFFIKGMTDNAEATSLIASEYYKAGSTLLSAGIGYQNYKTNKDIAEELGVLG
jgi:hypothetical protein